MSTIPTNIKLHCDLVRKAWLVSLNLKLLIRVKKIQKYSSIYFIRVPMEKSVFILEEHNYRDVDA